MSQRLRGVRPLPYSSSPLSPHLCHQGGQERSTLQKSAVCRTPRARPCWGLRPCAGTHLSPFPGEAAEGHLRGQRRDWNVGLADLSEMWALQLEVGCHQPGDVPTGPDPHPLQARSGKVGRLIGRSHPSRRLQLWEGFQGRGLGRQGQRPSLQPRCGSVHSLRGTFENTGGKLAQSRETGACSWAVGWGRGRQRRKAHE